MSQCACLSRFVGLAAIVVAVLGCATPPSPSPVEATPELTPGIEAGLRYSCGGIPFGPEAITGPKRNDETADNPVASTLRKFLVLPDAGSLPRSGWTFLGTQGPEAQFITLSLDGQIVSVELANAGGDWEVAGWGGCPAEILMADGSRSASWTFVDRTLIDAQLRSFDVLVTETACSGGQSAENRIHKPVVLTDATRVIVIFTVMPLPGGHDCPGNPPTKVHIDLPEPLGDRTILDGGVLPFRAPGVGDPPLG